MPINHNAVSFIHSAPLSNLNAHLPMPLDPTALAMPVIQREENTSFSALFSSSKREGEHHEQGGLNKRLRLLPSISSTEAPPSNASIGSHIEARRIQMKPYPGHIWLAGHPAHTQAGTPLNERSILLHAGGTLEQPDHVHENLWPQLSRLGNLDLAVVDFGSLGLLRSNEFHEDRVLAALKYLIQIGYQPERIALSGGSKGAYAAARANARLSATHRLGALVLCSPVLSAHSALSILLNRMSQRPDCPRVIKLLLRAIVSVLSPNFLNMQEVHFDPRTPTFIIKGGQDWAHNETSDQLLSEHIRSHFEHRQARNLNWITYEDAGHQLQIEDRHAQWVLAFLTGSKVGKIVGALEHQRFTGFPQVFRRQPEDENLFPFDEQDADSQASSSATQEIN